MSRLSWLTWLTWLSGPVRLGLRLAIGARGSQWLRAASVALATLVGTGVLLGFFAVVHAQEAMHPGTSPGTRGLLAAIVAAVVLPVVMLASTAGRLSAALRDRRLANLRLLGMTGMQVRIVAAVECGVSALVGSLLGLLGFLLLRPVLAEVAVAGRSWDEPFLWPPTWAWVAVVLGLPVVVGAVASMPQRLDLKTVLARARRADHRRPGWWRLVPLVVGAGLCLSLTTDGSANPEHTGVIVRLFAGVGLLGLGLVLVVPVFVRLLADAILALARRLGDRPTLTVAARRLQAQPAGVTRVVSGLLTGLFLVVGARCVVVSFEGTPQYAAAAHQVDVEQRVVVDVRADQTTATVRRIAAVNGIRHVQAFPVLASGCTEHSRYCLTAVVASCAELRAAVPRLGRCSNDFTRALEAVFGQQKPDHLPRLFPTDRFGNPRPHADGVRLPWPHNVARTTSGRPLRAALDPVSADLVVPPSVPGVAQLTTHTDHRLLVTAAPGRDLTQRLDKLGLTADGAYFDDYDYVAMLRAVVWTLAAIILAVGLLALAIAGLDRAVARRREITALQLVGMPRKMLTRTQWLEAALPLVLGCTMAIGLGLLAGSTYLSLVDGTNLPMPWSQALVLAGIAAVGAVLVGALTVIAASPRISPDLIRQE